MIAFALLALQVLISSDTATVNFVEGTGSAGIHQQIPEGGAIETGARSHVEVLLSPGVFLRLAENSRVVLDSLNPGIQLHVSQGEALIDAANLRRSIGLRIGNLAMAVAEPGVYRLSGDRIAVLEGQLETADRSETLKKGTQIAASDGKHSITPASATLVSFKDDDLYTWNRQRTKALVVAVFRLRGRVIADEVEPWTVEVRLDATDPGDTRLRGRHPSRPGAVLQRVQTSADGEFHFDDVQLGAYWVEIVDPRFRPARHLMTFKEPDDTQRISIVPLERVDVPPSARVLRESGRELIKAGENYECNLQLRDGKLLPPCALQAGIDALLKIPEPDTSDRDYLAVGYFKLGQFDAAQLQLALEISTDTSTMDSGGAKAFFSRCEHAGAGELENGRDSAGGGVCHLAMGTLDAYQTLFPKDPHHKDLEQIARKLRSSLEKSRKSATAADRVAVSELLTCSPQAAIRIQPQARQDLPVTDRTPARQEDLETILPRAAQYVVAYEERLGALVGEEVYVQKADAKGHFVSLDLTPLSAKKKQQRTESTFLILQVGKEWISARDVSCVDGVAVKGKVQEFLKATDDLKKTDIVRRLTNISQESASYNIGEIQRTTNLPTFPLRILRPGNKDRFEFKIGAETTIAGVRTMAVSFRETQGPTMIHDLEGQDEFANGTLWIDPKTGQVMKTEVNVAEHNANAAFRARTTVTYENSPKLGMLVPATMLEHYETDFGYSLDCRADYSNFRRPQADVRFEFGLPHHPNRYRIASGAFDCKSDAYAPPDGSRPEDSNSKPAGAAGLLP